MQLELRPAQSQVVSDVSAAFRAGHKRVLISAACGFGKTELATAILQATRENGKRAAFVADRRALVEQTSERFHKYGLEHGILMADHPLYRPAQHVQVCSAQTLARRKWPQTNLIVVDECHIMSETVKKKLMEKDCYAIGLSATAITKGLGKFFDTVVNAPPTNRLIEQNLLVPFEIFACTAPNMDGVSVTSLGEWDAKETEKRALEVVGDVVAEYIRLGQGKKFIGFASSIAHATELQRQFLAAGINVATYTADDRPEDRTETFQDFKRPESTLRGILSVEALTRGADVPQAEVLIMARPLRKACHVFVQMLGRVMRTSPSTGKTSAIVLDHAGNCVRFWREWNHLFEHGVTSLDDGKPKEKKEAQEDKELEPMTCPTCKHVHMPRPTCPQCGHEYPRRQAVQHVPGVLQKLAPSSSSQEDGERAVYAQIKAYVLRHKEGEAARRETVALFIDIFGHVAKLNWYAVDPQAPTPEVSNKIRAMKKRFHLMRGLGKSARSAA
jgi:DNA repair protein RadD